jgi:hypothetical protein
MQFSDSYARMAGWIEFPDVIIKSRKAKLILRIIFSLLTVASILYLRFFGDSDLCVSLLTGSLIGLIVVFLLTSKYYDWAFILFILVFIALCYKKMHWPYNPHLMALGTTLLATMSWYNAFKFLYTYQKNPFLKWFGFFSGIIIAFFMMGFLWKNEHWPGATALIGSGGFLFVFSVFALAFILPFSNYVAWSDIERKVFFRAVLTPMLFILIIFTLLFVFPDVYNSLTGRYATGIPWNLWGIDLLKLEGI